MFFKSFTKVSKILPITFLFFLIFQLNAFAKTEIITLGGGCFWCTEAVYQTLKGVISVESGYSGGFIKNPTYEQVSSGNSGHAEVVQIKFDPNKINLEKILEVFWKVHDPTTLNQQGNDIGTQYRSVIYYTNKKQKEIAEKSKLKAFKSELWGKTPIVTEITAFTTFYKAEEYHRNYYLNNPDKSYCVYVIDPKVQKVKKEFRNLLKEFKK
jgi:peptide-methionine (S)-S-oxide reductase